jgi:hypothetical protein
MPAQKRVSLTLSGREGGDLPKAFFAGDVGVGGLEAITKPVGKGGRL